MGSLGIDSPAPASSLMFCCIPILCHPNIQSTLDYVSTTGVLDSKYAQNVKSASSLPRQPVVLIFYSLRQQQTINATVRERWHVPLSAAAERHANVPSASTCPGRPPGEGRDGNPADTPRALRSWPVPRPPRASPGNAGAPCRAQGSAATTSRPRRPGPCPAAAAAPGSRARGAAPPRLHGPPAAAVPARPPAAPSSPAPPPGPRPPPLRAAATGQPPSPPPLAAPGLGASEVVALAPRPARSRPLAGVRSGSGRPRASTRRRCAGSARAAGRRPGGCSARGAGVPSRPPRPPGQRRLRARGPAPGAAASAAPASTAPRRRGAGSPAPPRPGCRPCAAVRPGPGSPATGAPWAAPAGSCRGTRRPSTARSPGGSGPPWARTRRRTREGSPRRGAASRRLPWRRQGRGMSTSTRRTWGTWSRPAPRPPGQPWAQPQRLPPAAAP